MLICTILGLSSSTIVSGHAKGKKIIDEIHLVVPELDYRDRTGEVASYKHESSIPEASVSNNSQQHKRLGNLLPVDPTSSKAHSRVNITLGKLKNTSSYGQPGTHFRGAHEEGEQYY